jgi:chromatin segregation and condensation protein Rec8/ScpA/Scc1 (kleisin family)
VEAAKASETALQKERDELLRRLAAAEAAAEAARGGPWRPSEAVLVLPQAKVPEPAPIAETADPRSRHRLAAEMAESRSMRRILSQDSPNIRNIRRILSHDPPAQEQSIDRKINQLSRTLSQDLGANAALTTLRHSPAGEPQAFARGDTVILHCH